MNEAGYVVGAPDLQHSIHEKTDAPLDQAVGRDDVPLVQLAEAQNLNLLRRQAAFCGTRMEGRQRGHLIAVAIGSAVVDLDTDPDSDPDRGAQPVTAGGG
jgi:uncharacterized protein (DUF169 family)